MALAALISACQVADDGEQRLRATLPLAGRTLVEHQARLAAHAGATHVVVLVERVPPALTASIDRLRRDGIRIEVARTLEDAVDRVHPEETLLLIADGCVAGPMLVERIAAAASPAILTLPDHPPYADFERIDAADRWAGLLLTDGQRLRQTVAMLGDWNLESTLLRRAVQEGATRIRATSGAARDEADDLLLIAADAAALDGFDADLAAKSRRRGADWPSRYLFPWFERIILPPLLGKGVDSLWLAIGALSLATISAPLAWAGWRWAALVLLLLSGPLAALGNRLAAARLGVVRHARVFAVGRAMAAMLTMAFITAGLMREAGWGVALLAVLLLLAMAAAYGEKRILARLPGGAAPLWLASLDGLIWLGLPFAIPGWWLPGLAALAAYAVGSFFALQREVASRVAVRRSMDA